MQKEQSAPRWTRRTLLGLLVPALLFGGWLLVKALVRKHVDGVIQAAVGRPLPEFVLRDRQGVEWTGQRLRGRPALLHFLRSRCESCELEAPELRLLERELPAEQATILHVMTDVVLGFPPAETAATIEREAFVRPVLLADAAFVDAFHSVQWSNVTPVTYLVDAQGNIRTALRGRQTAAGLRQALQAIQ